MKTVPEPNPFRHIEFFPATGKFRVNLPDSRYTQAKYPVFDSLQEAMEFRDQIFAGYEANERTRQTANYHKHYETRPFNA